MHHLFAINLEGVIVSPTLTTLVFSAGEAIYHRGEHLVVEAGQGMCYRSYVIWDDGDLSSRVVLSHKYIGGMDGCFMEPNGEGGQARYRFL